MENTVRLPNGCTLYWEEVPEIGPGVRRYLSDEVGGGVVVWETALVDPSTLLAAIVQEQTLLTEERVRKEKKNG